jgi:transposase
MGAILDLKGRPAKTEIQYDLKELSVARQALVKDRVAAKNRRHAAVNALIKRQLAARIKQIEGQLAEIDTAIMACVMAVPDLARRFEILCSIPGIGKITAIALLIDMPELGSVDNKQIASLAGLAPMTRQSGG